MKTLMALLAILVVGCLIPEPLAAQDPVVAESDHDIDEGAAVSVDCSSGVIRVLAEDRANAHLRTSKRGTDVDKVTFQIQSDRKSLRVETKYAGRVNNVAVEIDLILPRKALGNVAVTSVSGPIDVRGVTAVETTLHATSGRVQVHDLRSDLVLKCVSGNVEVSKLIGKKADINLTSGSLAGSAELQDLRIEGVSGGVSFDLQPPREGPWTAKASVVSGKVALRLPAWAGGAMELTTSAGRLSCGLATRDSKSEGRFANKSLKASFGSGSGVVRVSTVAGEIRIDPLE